MKKSITPEQIDALLPQTQCGLCTYPGCMPYATALAENRAEINLCPPGGVDGLLAIANLLQRDPTPFITDMQQKAKPSLTAVIREEECIGCTKCIQACPVDAILGGPKLMHTVITSECTGCELCVEPCPVDCIDILPLPIKSDNVTEKKQRADYLRGRYRARENRLLQKNERDEVTKPILNEKKLYIEAAILRAKMKKT